jgi:hypothetical protein
VRREKCEKNLLKPVAHKEKVQISNTLKNIAILETFNARGADILFICLWPPSTLFGKLEGISESRPEPKFLNF